MSISGRYPEKKIFQDVLDSKQPEFLAVYGRRRVGKTYLIREFFKNKGLYFELTGAKAATQAEQLLHFSQSLQKSFSLSLLPATPDSWSVAFEQLKEVLQNKHSTQKIILFFDELPWLASPKSGFLGALDYFWNQWASTQKNIKLIVCGSAASWMLDKIVESKGGLHNRLTRTIRLLPFDLQETFEYFKNQNINLDQKQILNIYLAMGGVPHYLKQIQKGLSATQNINQLCFHKDGFLADEFHKLYASLFDEAEAHIKIVKILAKHRYGLTRDELLVLAKFSSGGGSHTILRNLEEAGFVESLIPVGKQKYGKIYRLCDEYSYFYLKWIATAPQSVFKEKNSNYWLMKQSTPSWQAWSGYAFEAICLKHIQQIKKALGISGVISAQNAWSYKPKNKTENGAQIDLLIDRADNVISLCEIKFSDEIFTISKSYEAELRQKIQIFKEKTKTRKTIFLVMITPYGVAQNAAYTNLVNNEVVLQDLF